MLICIIQIANVVTDVRWREECLQRGDTLCPSVISYPADVPCPGPLGAAVIPSSALFLRGTKPQYIPKALVPL